MAHAIAKLTKTIEEKDMQISSLINKVEAQVQNTGDSSQGLNHLPNVASPLDDAPHTYRTMQVERQMAESASVAIDNLRMPMGYQPPKFQSFDGKENPKQHATHFVETCNNASTDGDLLVKQFVYSLRGNAFDWCIDLAPKCINNYINRWRSLSLDCKDKLFEVSAMEMCIQGMHWGLLYILQGIQPPNHGSKKDLTIDRQRERHDGKRSDKTSKKPIQESMMINMAPIKISTRDKSKEVKEVGPIQENERRRFTLKELEEKKYHFPDSDVPNMLEDLLRKRLSILPAIIPSTGKAKFKGKVEQSKTKKTKASTQHITVEDMEESSGSNSPPRISVFDRIEAPITRASMFTRLVQIDSNSEFSKDEPREAPRLFENGGKTLDLNNVCPKDDFLLPIIELMVDATIGHEALSFMDGSLGYNQIRMAPRDEDLIAFRTPKGIYYYKVMPFGLKNAGATYQRAMQKIFDDMLHKNVECYVDDLVVKSIKKEYHLQDLHMVFVKLRRYQFKMNPLKCAFGVTFGKFYKVYCSTPWHLSGSI
ncbi:hypothetical protein AAG906_019991 [Vitis piasezkii]